MKRLSAMCLGVWIIAAGSQLDAAPMLSQGFEDITTLAGDGWVVINNSSPVGTTDWFQGNTGVFAAQAGPSDSYVAANFDNAGFGGDIDNWLLTPVLSLSNQSMVTFWTRTEPGSPFADRLTVALSTNGASTDVAADFSAQLTINSSLAVPGYPEDWTMYTVNLTGIGAPATGRIGFHYAVPDTSTNGNYIGIDTLSIGNVPEPSTVGLMAAGLAALALRRMRRNRR